MDLQEPTYTNKIEFGRSLPMYSIIKTFNRYYVMFYNQRLLSTDNTPVRINFFLFFSTNARRELSKLKRQSFSEWESGLWSCWTESIDQRVPSKKKKKMKKGRDKIDDTDDGVMHGGSSILQGRFTFVFHAIPNSSLSSPGKPPSHLRLCVLYCVSENT